MNSGNIRRKFAHVFAHESATGNPDHIATPTVILTGSSTRGTAGMGMGGRMSRRKGSTQERNVTGCRRALFALDPKNADGRLFLVLQLSKVLQGEPEKVGCLGREEGAHWFTFEGLWGVFLGVYGYTRGWRRRAVRVLARGEVIDLLVLS